MKPLTVVRAVLPVVVLAAAGYGAKTLLEMRVAPERSLPEPAPPLVSVVAAQPLDVPLEVLAHGTVVPRAELELVAEVSGRVVWVSPDLVAGGFVEAGAPLLRIDRRDYEEARAAARLELARAERVLAQEQAAARTAAREWRELGRGEGTPLALHQPQLAEALASREAAWAALARTGYDLERTTLRAPFVARVRSEQVAVGAYVTPGVPLARLDAIDRAEVRLALDDRELAFLELPLEGPLPFRPDDAAASVSAASPPLPAPGRPNAPNVPAIPAASGPPTGPFVRLTGRFAGVDHEWSGHIVRTEGELDPATRMLVAVASVDDPYDRAGLRDGPPLTVGQFVQARIAGVVARHVFSLPRSALRDGDRLYLLSDALTLERRPVHVLRRERERVLIDSGLSEDERVIVSPLELALPGMALALEQQSP